MNILSFLERLFTFIDLKSPLGCEADPRSPLLSSSLQVCRTDDQQRRSCPGVAGAEGVLRHAHHQHREERHGVSVTARPQTSPCPSIGFPPIYPSPLSEGKGEGHVF